jgi:hypothetical protein
MKLNIKNAISLISIVVILASFLIIPIYARTPGFVGYDVEFNSPNDVFVVGNRAYVVDDSDTLSEVDISIPSSPVVLRTITGAGAPNYLGNPTSVFVVGNYAYITAYDDSTLTIIDISGVGFAVAGHVTDSGSLSQVTDVYVSGNYAYVTSYNGGAAILEDPGLLTIVLVSDPLAPSVLGSVVDGAFPNYLGGAYRVEVSGNYAYVTALSHSALVVVNISNPLSPSVTGRLVESGISSLKVSGNYAYVCEYSSAKLIIVNINNPYAPTKVGSISGSGSPNYLGFPTDVDLYGNYAVVTNEVYDQSLTLIDVTTPASPTFAGVVSGIGAPNYLYNPVALQVSGDYAYVCASDANSLNIFQLSLRAPSIAVLDATNVSTSTAKLNANIISDGGEDVDETEVRYGYGTTSLFQVGTLEDNTTSTATGIATGAPILLSGGFTEATYRTTTITVTGAGTFDITLPAGITGTATSGTATLAGSPVNLPAASTTTVDTGATTGTFTVLIDNEYDTVTSWVSGWTQGDNPQLSVSSLVSGTLYYFTAQAKNSAYTVSATNQLSFTTYPAPDNVTYFIGNPLETTLKLAWAMPDGASTVLIRYDTDTFPTSIIDGYEAYNGSSSSTEYPSSAPYLTPGKTYFFSIWGVDNVTYSPGYKTLALTTLGTSFTDISGGDLLPTPAFPSNWGGPVAPSVLSNFEPFYSMIGSFATSWGVPTETMWLIIALVIIAFVGFLVLIETQKLMAAVIAVGIGMLAASMMHVLPTYFIAIALLCFLGAWRLESSTG